MEITNESSLHIQEDTFSQRILQTGLLVDKYYTPLLCILGAFGNSLSLLVFCMDGKYRRQSSSYYLSTLAVSDTGFLLNLFAVWLESVVGGIITSHLTCPIVMYLGQVTCFMSVYLTVGFSLERYIAINFPFSKPSICTKSKAKKFIASVVTIALLVFSYAWFIAKVIEIPIPSASQTCEDDLNVELLIAHANNSKKWVRENSTDYSQEQLSPTLLIIKTDNELYHTPKNSSCSGSLSDHIAKIYICTVPERYYKISEIANYLDSGVTLIIPFLLITFFNMGIAKSVWRLESQRKHIVASVASTLNPTIIMTTLSNPTGNDHVQQQRQSTIASVKEVENPLNPDKTNGVVLSLSLKPMKTGTSYSSQWSNSCNRNVLLAETQNMNLGSSRPFLCKTHKTQQQPPRSEVLVTKTLLLVSTVFLVLNLPLHAIRCTQFIQAATGTPEGHDILQILQPWANMLFNTNFAVNFLIYCVSGSNFRKSLRNIGARIVKIRMPIQHTPS